MHRSALQGDRGVASPSTSGSRGGEHATPFLDQRGHFAMPAHGKPFLRHTLCPV